LLTERTSPVGPVGHRRFGEPNLSTPLAQFLFHEPGSQSRRESGVPHRDKGGAQQPESPCAGLGKDDGRHPPSGRAFEALGPRAGLMIRAGRIVCALADRDEAMALAAHLSHAGWALPVEVLEPLGLSWGRWFRDTRERLDSGDRNDRSYPTEDGPSGGSSPGETQRFLIALWSGEAAQSAGYADALRRLGEEAELCLIRLDAAASPLENAAEIDLSAGPLQAWDGRSEGLFSIVREALGPAGPSIGPGPLMTAPQWRGRAPGRRRLKILAALILGAGLTLLWSGVAGSGLRGRAIVDGPSEALPEPVEDAETAYREALADWAKVAREDPTDVRSFIARHGATAAVKEAREVLLFLEDRAFEALGEGAEPIAQLKAIERYRIDFPGGARAAEADLKEAEAREAIAQAARDLTRLGFYNGPADGLVRPELTEAIAAFERFLGLPVTSRLGAGVIGALESSGSSRTAQ
jgi:hypothetical protein